MKLEDIKLYKESNDRIADLLLLCDDNMMCLYAGAYIKSLEEQIKSYKDLEEQGKLLKLQIETVWFICDKNTKYAMVMSKSIRDLKIYEIEGIDKKGYYWSSKEAAESALKEMSERREG